jgi:DNA polymerase-3 subunit epsilon
MLDFVALDFETANSFRASACSLGMTRVIGGKVVAEKGLMFRPPKGFDEFSPRNIQIHGIRPEDVERKPRFGEYWDEVWDFLRGYPLVAHSAAFDMSVLRSALMESHIEVPEVQYACTIVMSKMIFPMHSYRLPFVARKMGIDWDSKRHHEAVFDANIAAQIAARIGIAAEALSLEDLVEKLGMTMGYMSRNDYFSCSAYIFPDNNEKSQHQYTHAKEVEMNKFADQSHPLFGKEIVITGELFAMTRDDAWFEIGNYGAIPWDSVRRSTDILIVTDEKYEACISGLNQTGKYRRAIELQEQGFPLEIMTEDSYMYYSVKKSLVW